MFINSWMSNLFKNSWIRGLFILIFILATLSTFFYYNSFIPQIAQLKTDYPHWQDGKLIAIRPKLPKSWVRLSTIKREVRMAIVVSEDWEFYNHPGIDVVQIKDAIWEHLLYSTRLRGASTITQQVVKNLLLTNERTFSRKFVEVIGALYMDDLLSKDQILEIYLNIVQFGDHIYGISAASRHYFGKNASELSAREGAFLAMLLPNPVKYSQSFKRRELSRYALNTMTTILQKMKMARVIDEERLMEEISSRFEWEDRISEELNFPWDRFKLRM